jgi:hypothetical protein
MKILVLLPKSFEYIAPRRVHPLSVFFCKEVPAKETQSRITIVSRDGANFV